LTDFQKEQLQYQIERSPFSEEFVITCEGPLELVSVFGEVEMRGDDTGCIVRGLFDSSIDQDTAHSVSKPKPRLMVYSFPRDLPQDTSITVRGKAYRIRKQEVDTNIGYVIHLN
jgi:hypothetical protein